MLAPTPRRNAAWTARHQGSIVVRDAAGVIRRMTYRRPRPQPEYRARGLAPAEYRAGMLDFAHALSLMALIAATLQYAILLRHREERRDATRSHAEVNDSLLSSGRFKTAAVRRWNDEGTRFRIER